MFKTKISSDYFMKQGLEHRTGMRANNWNILIAKEIIDNALDAIESNSNKKIIIHYDRHSETLKIFDNGNGLSFSDIKDIYDFDNYVSKNRHFITISRGKLGNGLKCIIGICQICGYNLIWHTNENEVIYPQLDIDNVQDGEINIEFVKNDGFTAFKGIEIRNIIIDNSGWLYTIIKEFSDCNNDVLFSLDYPSAQCTFEPTADPVNKQAETSLTFYDFQEYKRLLSVQNGGEKYKTFLGNIFGIRIKNASAIKCEIKNLNIDDVEADFYALQQLQNKKPLTLLKKHIIHYKNIIEHYPYIIEYEAENSGRINKNCVMINNSITYFDASSVEFDLDDYQITASKKIKANTLHEILNAYKDYKFRVHIINPKPLFKDYGKAKIDISDISHLLVDDIRKTVNREKRKNPVGKRKSKKGLAFENMNEAFQMASSGGKYSITARQMYYKLREIIGNAEWETEYTYNTFTQEWLTQWIDDNPHYENKVNFSDRGNFIVDGDSKGIGSENVRNFIAANGAKENRFILDADIDMTYQFDFDVKYQYDKALYIEKTGFNEVFIAEGIQEKYNMIIVSGQGYASRSARQLLYDLQQRGLKIYCMHDLDAYGMVIYEAMRWANDKFKHDINIMDLGVTPADVKKYNIVPERIKAGKNDLSKLPLEYQEFFKNNKGHSQRVELNSFTTEQLLEIIDDKLKNTNCLPEVDISKVIQINLQKYKEFAVFQLVKSKYEKMLSGVSIDNIEDIYPATTNMTYHVMVKLIPEIKRKILSKLTTQLDKAINHFESYESAL